MFVAKKAAGLYLVLYNRFRGTAWFSNVSWEPIIKANTYTYDERQDPHTGSLAKNVMYDEMPYHLKYHALAATRYQWRFVLGPRRPATARTSSRRPRRTPST